MCPEFGRGRGIRTPDPLLPKQMRYQTAPCPVPARSLYSAGRHRSRSATQRNTPRRFATKTPVKIGVYERPMLISALVHWRRLLQVGNRDLAAMMAERGLRRARSTILGISNRHSWHARRGRRRRLRASTQSFASGSGSCPSEYLDAPVYEFLRKKADVAQLPACDADHFVVGNDPAARLAHESNRHEGRLADGSADGRQRLHRCFAERRPSGGDGVRHSVRQRL